MYVTSRKVSGWLGAFLHEYGRHLRGLTGVTQGCSRRGAVHGRCLLRVECMRGDENCYVSFILHRLVIGYAAP